MAILRPIRNYPIVAFTILACLIGWVQIIAHAFGANIAPDAIPLGPIVAAFIVAACLGRDELKEWGRRLATFRASIGWYALASIAPIVIITIVALINYALGATPPTTSQLAAIWADLPGTFIFLLIFVGIGEEAGWTAFAAPILLRRNSFIKSWLILSTMRVLWHIPLMLTGDLPWVLGTFGNIAFQFLILWMFLRSNQVWFLAALSHAIVDTVGGNFFFRLLDGTDQTRLAILMSTGFAIVALTVYCLDRRNLDRFKEVNQQVR